LLVEDDPLLALQRRSALERKFAEVDRVAYAAEALCLVERPGFAARLGLVICSHTAVGLGSPSFVAELQVRLPDVPVLVTGGADADAYRGEMIHVLRAEPGIDEFLAAACRMAPLSARKTA
jgi:DNA-binding response OmpR family regulator